MRTLKIFTFIILFFPFVMEGQPLADLSFLEEGDSVQIKVHLQVQEEHPKDKGKRDLLVKKQEYFYYTLKLVEAKGTIYQFQGNITRFESRYDAYKYKQGALKSDHHWTYDTEFDTHPNLRAQYLRVKDNSFLNQTFLLEIDPNKTQHTLSLAEGSKLIKQDFATSYLNPKGLINHVNAIFFTKNQPIEHGTIVAKQLGTNEVKPVIITGKIVNRFGDKIYSSDKPTTGVSQNMTLFDQEVVVEEDGSFQFRFEIDKPRFLFFYHHIARDIMYPISKERIIFPLYLEPGDQIHILMDGAQPNEFEFEGVDAPRYRAFHEFSQKYLGPNIDSYVYLSPFGKAVERLTYVKVAHMFPVVKDVDQRYQEVMSFLESHRDQLGETFYYRLKAECVYNYATRKLDDTAEEDWHTDLTKFNLRGLSLSEKRDYYLDSLGLTLESVKESYAYSVFLYEHLYAHMGHIRKFDIKHVPSATDPFAFALFAYQDFALLTLLKELIQTQLKTPSNIANYDPGTSLLVEEVLSQRIQEYFAMCKHEPYLAQIENELGKYRKLKKGQPAPDMKLNDTTFLKDYTGEKMVLVFFQDVTNKQMEFYSSLAEKYPEVKFLFLFTGEYHQEFLFADQVYKHKGEMFHSPGYGSGIKRPYMYSGFRRMINYMIDQEGKLWGSEKSKYNDEAFAAELAALAEYDPNYFQQFFVEKRKLIFTVVWVITALVSLYLIYFFLYLRPKRKREKLHTERIETELRAIRSQMNPHFLFNSLTSVQNLINQSDKEKANHYLTRFSQLVRKVLNHSEQALIPLEAELKVVDLYCELEALRFKFEYVIEVDPEIDVHTLEVPSMLIQPYVENAVRHGLAMQVGAGYIEVYVRKEEDYVEVEILDNGIGIRKHQEEYAGHLEKSGFGLRLSEERIVKINERYKMDIAVELQDRRDDLEPSHGTRVLIQIPLEV